MNCSNVNTNNKSLLSFSVKDIIILLMMLITIITNIVFNYFIFINLNINKEDKMEENKALEIYHSKINFENEIKLLKMNENYLHNQIDTLESIVRETMNQQKICLGLCW